MDDQGLVREVEKLVGAHPAVRAVSLVGSRERGEATKWSDWDFAVATNDFELLSPALPSLVEPLRPLVAQWDRLSDQQCYMLVIRGPKKVDLLFDVPHEHEPAHRVSAATLAAIDAHFWDWMLWLTSKQGASKNDIVRAELVKMTEHLLGPLGVTTTPTTLADTLREYLAARGLHEERLGVEVPRELGDEVTRVIREQASELELR